MSFMGDIWNRVTGQEQKREEQQREEQQPQQARERATAALVKNAEDRQRQTTKTQQAREQAARDRLQRPGPAERYIASQPVLKEAVIQRLQNPTAKEPVKPTQHDFQTPLEPKQQPSIQVPRPGGGFQTIRLSQQGSSPQQVTNDRQQEQPSQYAAMLDRLTQAPNDRPRPGVEHTHDRDRDGRTR